MTKDAETGWRARRGAVLAVVVWTGVAAGCSSQEPPVTLQLPAADGQSGPLFEVSSCAGYDSESIERACTIDSSGKAYPLNGRIWVIPAAPPYAAFFQFRPGYVPLAQDLDSASDDPSIRVVAAPARTDVPCCVDPSVTIHPPVQATLTDERGLLVTITDVVPVGHEVRVTLLYMPLYQHMSNPCVLPNPAFCRPVNDTSFGLGFDVGAGPQ